MRKLVITLGMLFLCQNAAAEIRMVPFIDCKTPGGVFLSIKNIGDKEESIKESQLPWMPSSPLIRLSSLASSDGKLEELPVDHMVFDTFNDPSITLSPGQIMHGFLSFNRVISDFDSRRQEGEILMLLSSRQPLLPTRGVILIPRSGRFFGKNQCPAYAALPKQ